MFQHDAKGATGLVVNRPVAEVALADFLARFGVDSQGVSGRIRVHYGGPVEPSRVFVLHTEDDDHERKWERAMAKRRIEL